MCVCVATLKIRHNWDPVCVCMSECVRAQSEANNVHSDRSNNTHTHTHGVMTTVFSKCVTAGQQTE